MQEGVIHYQLDFVQQPLAAALDIQALEACRARLYARGLVGQDAGRYGGLGFGNVSVRCGLAGNPDAFLITGSQTGHLPNLGRQHYALVTACGPLQNQLRAEGETPPSSEAMTHAVVYQTLPQVQAVIHVHWPELWQNAAAAGLPCTAPAIPYGTPQMARAVQAILQAHPNPQAGLLAMLGHEDGLLAWGTTGAEAEAQLTQYG